MIITKLKNLVQMPARINRKDFAIQISAMYVLLVVCVQMLNFTTSFPKIIDLAISGALYLTAFVAIVVMIYFTIARLHDFNRSGWFIFLAIILALIIGIAPIALFLLIFKGTNGANKYGEAT